MSADRRPPLLAAYEALSGSRFARVMNWLIAAAGVAYAASLLLADWPRPGTWTLLAGLGAGLGVLLAAVDVKAWSGRVLGRILLRRMVRRPIR